MTQNNKWTRFLPSKLEQWIRGGEEADDAVTVEAGPAPYDPLLTYAPPGVEWLPGGEPQGPSCPVCGTEYAADAAPDAPCPHCGADRPGHGLPAGIAESQSRVLNVEAGFQPRRPCTACGSEVDVDGYCMTCGSKQTSERDHFREEPARWLAGVCDRGVRHLRNEDAMALSASQRPQDRGVLVVCDAVSTSVDSDVAALAGAEAARDVLSANQPKGVGSLESRSAAMSKALVEACRAADDAVIANTAPDSPNAASATFAAAVVSEGRIFYANLGDSRVYWFGDGAEGVLLSLDDSVAQVRIEAGVPREEAENGEGAHAITKWLGRDSLDIEPRVGELQPDGPGWLLVCTDGLWNYASPPAELGQVLADAIGADPRPASLVDLCEAMVAWANLQGGRDNITVAIARLGDLDMLTPDVEPSERSAPIPVRVPDRENDHAAVIFEQPDWSGPAPSGHAAEDSVPTPYLPAPVEVAPPADDSGPIAPTNRVAPAAIVESPPAD